MQSGNQVTLFLKFEIVHGILLQIQISKIVNQYYCFILKNRFRDFEAPPPKRYTFDSFFGRIHV